MPALPIQYSASSSRQALEPRDASSIPSFLSDTSSRIRLRTEAISNSQPPPPLSTPNNHLDLARRQNQIFAIPASYKGLDAGPSPGTVVGITLGSVLGFLLLVWLIQSVVNSSGAPVRYIEGDASEIVVTRRSDRSRQRTSRRARTRRSAPRSEVTSATSTGPPPPIPRQPSPRRRTERIIVEETRRTESRPATMPMPPPMAERVVERETIFEERRVDGDDVVEVIEEHSDVSGTPERRRRPSKSGFRPVDPGAYGGGNYAQRDVYERRNSRRAR